jgi:hypothetical protein
MILDDDIGAALCAFAPTARIVSDSCYSGTVADLSCSRFADPTPSQLQRNPPRRCRASSRSRAVSTHLRPHFEQCDVVLVSLKADATDINRWSHNAVQSHPFFHMINDYQLYRIEHLLN